jgi:hypothetical protein
MPQIKFFKGVETDLPGLENKVNTWMTEPGIRVINIFGNMAPQTASASKPADSLVTQSGYGESGIFIAVLYENV